MTTNGLPVVYASALNGTSSMDPEKQDDNMLALYETIIDHIPSLQRKWTSLSSSSLP